jgi:hypothetical protein
MALSCGKFNRIWFSNQARMILMVNAGSPGEAVGGSASEGSRSMSLSQPRWFIAFGYVRIYKRPDFTHLKCPMNQCRRCFVAEFLEPRRLMSSVALQVNPPLPQEIAWDAHETLKDSSDTQNYSGRETELVGYSSVVNGTTTVEFVDDNITDSQGVSYTSYSPGGVTFDSFKSSDASETTVFSYKDFAVPAANYVDLSNYSSTGTFKGSRSGTSDTGDAFYESSKGTVTRSRTYLGTKTITVPAGKFSTRKYQEKFGFSGTLTEISASGKRTAYAYSETSTRTDWVSSHGTNVKGTITSVTTIGTSTTTENYNFALLSDVFT